MPQNTKEIQSLTIKSLAEDDRPREKMLLNGRQSLSNAELIAILIGSGSRSESAIQLAQRILNSADNNINSLAKLSINDLKKFKGIGEAKAITIVAALELGRRRKDETTPKVVKIDSSNGAYLHIKHRLEDLPHEEFWIMLLSRANKVLNTECISRGGITGTIADIKIIMKLAIENLASGIILVHNHPSGNLIPSQADKELTSKITEASKYIDLNVLDHLIIGDNNYYSFADHGII